MKRASSLIFCLSLFFGAVCAEEAQTFDRLTFHAAPKAPSPKAIWANWPRVLGPQDNGSTEEAPLLKQWPESGLKAIWEVKMGEGYTSPIISGDYCVIFHALEKMETELMPRFREGRNRRLAHRTRRQAAPHARDLQ